MWIEFSPVFMEKWGMKVQKKKLEKVLFFFIALGTLLPMMHQSSLGTLLVVMGPQVNPLWQTPIVPLLFLLSAITIGYGVVLFESCVAFLGLPAGDRDAPAAADGEDHARRAGVFMPCASAT
jgi:Ni/Fe-hydrogenase subunit HybB-like protein